MPKTITLQLKQPITAHNEEYTELTFVEPTTEMLIRIGQPVISNKKGGAIDYEKTAKYISRLAGIPQNSVNQLCPRDFTEASNICVGLVLGLDEDGDEESEGKAGNAEGEARNG